MANINLKQMFAASPMPAQAPDMYAVADQQKAIAEELRKRAMQGGRFQGMLNTGQTLGIGLSQLGEALLARKAAKDAQATQAGADAKMRDATSQGIEKLAGAYQIGDVAGEGATPLLGGSLPGSKIETALAGTDPRKANEVVAEALLRKAMPKEPKQTVLPYGARMVDEKGNLVAENTRIPGAATNSGDMQWLTKFMEANPTASFADAAEAHAKYKRSMQPDRPPDPVTPVTIASPTSPAGVIKDARTGRVIGDAVPTSSQAASGEKANGRVAALTAAKDALTRVQESSNTLGSGGGVIEGRLPAMGEVTQDYDGAVAQLLAAIQSALRVPGIGSQSNMELQALMKALPLRTQEQKVRDNQITGIAKRLETIISRESGVPDGAAPPSKAPPSAEAYLKANPQFKDAFKSKYGYLPEGM